MEILDNRLAEKLVDIFWRIKVDKEERPRVPAKRRSLRPVPMPSSAVFPGLTHTGRDVVRADYGLEDAHHY